MYSNNEYASNFSMWPYNDSASSIDVLQSEMTPIGVAISIIYGVLLALGLVGNIWVAWFVGFIILYGKQQAVRSVQCYILTLCFSDIFLLLSMSLLLGDLLAGQWIFGTFLCSLYATIDYMYKIASPFILAALSATCYVFICNRDAETQAGSAKTAIVVILATFAWVLLLVTPVFLYTDVQMVSVSLRSVKPKCGFMPSYEVGTAFTIASFCVGYLLPTTCFCYCYARVLHYIRTHNLSFQSRSVPFWKVAKTVLALVFAYLCCWTPYWILLLSLYFVDPPTISNFVVVIGYMIHLLPYVSCTVYPIVYTLLNRHLQEAHVDARLRRRLRRPTKDGSIDSTTCRKSTDGTEGSELLRALSETKPPSSNTPPTYHSCSSDRPKILKHLSVETVL